ncbi:hypothetical protein PT974_10500 [Cladobotryum mycophilum]|uniref:DUF6546 domain-containing protein n=1 Tax=Cladobotryum mycophilum TaxID=491253 RepID=A0ABR0SA18_9HYPO
MNQEDDILRRLGWEILSLQPPCWGSLPAELRTMILEWTATISKETKCPLAGYASVNQEWRDFFEPLTFRSLRLLPTCLDEFDRIVRDAKRRQHVRHIWFRYNRRCRCENRSFRFLEPVNMHAFAAGIIHLFHILESWTGRDRSENAPLLTLELSAFAAIDPDHSMKDSVPEEIEGVDLENDKDVRAALYRKHPAALIHRPEAQFSEWERKSYYLSPSRTDPFPAGPLPKVRAVNLLVIRRHTHSVFFAPFLKTIIPALPCLVSLTYEPWRKHPSSQEVESALLSQIISILPSCFRGLVIFEDHSETYRGHGTPRVYTDRCSALAQQLSRVGNLKHLCVSYAIDAKDFFADFYTTSTTSASREWGKLETLTLTSNLIRLDESPDSITRLLLAAGRAAKNMPNLKGLEIYNVHDLDGGVFRFRVTDEVTVVSWVSSWKFELSEEAIQPWREMYEQSRSQSFEVRVFAERKRFLEWPSCILPVLYSRKIVVHPVTYCNMMNGNNRL